MEIHVYLVLKNVDFLGKCECRSAKSKPTIAIAAVTREVYCIGAVFQLVLT